VGGHPIRDLVAAQKKIYAPYFPISTPSSIVCAPNNPKLEIESVPGGAATRRSRHPVASPKSNGPPTTADAPRCSPSRTAFIHPRLHPRRVMPGSPMRPIADNRSSFRFPGRHGRLASHRRNLTTSRRRTWQSSKIWSAVYKSLRPTFSRGLQYRLLPPSAWRSQRPRRHRIRISGRHTSGGLLHLHSQHSAILSARASGGPDPKAIYRLHPRGQTTPFQPEASCSYWMRQRRCNS